MMGSKDPGQITVLIISPVLIGCKLYLGVPVLFMLNKVSRFFGKDFAELAFADYCRVFVTALRNARQNLVKYAFVIRRIENDDIKLQSRVTYICDTVMLNVGQTHTVTKRYKSEYMALRESAMCIGRCVGFVVLLYIGVFGGIELLRWALLIMGVVMIWSAQINVAISSKLRAA